jgi:hypothetical protein
MDYETEPFLMLIKAFKEFMKEKNIDKDKTKEWLDKAKECFSIRNILKLGFNIVVDKTIGVDTLKEFINNTYDTCFDQMSDNESLYDQLVRLLNEITSQFKEPVYIIIDELDRCRPDFALETLERIKHIFNVKNVKFILVYNEKIIMSMINRKYGDTIDAKKYLTKFVQMEYIFDNKESPRRFFLAEVRKRFKNNNFMRLLENYDYQFTDIITSFNLGLRDIQRILTNLELYTEARPDIILIEFLKYINKQQFEDMVKYYIENEKFTPTEPERDIYNKILSIFTSIKDSSIIAPDSQYYDRLFYEYVSKGVCII